MYQALNKNNGKLVWAYDTKQDGAALNFHGNGAVSETLVVTGSDDPTPGNKGFVYAFERASGKLRWKYAAGKGVLTDIVTHGQKIYTVTLGDDLVCLDLETGQQNWKFSSGVTNGDSLVNSSPAISAGRVYFGGMNGTIYALDESSGRVTWKRELGLRVSTSIAVLGNSLYVGTIVGHLYRLAANTGEILGDYPLDGRAEGTLTVAENLILVPLGDEAIVSLDPDLKHQRWLKMAPQTWTTARPFVLDGSVLLADRGTLFAYQLVSGNVVWTHDFGDVVRGLGSDKGVLYVGTLKGTVYAYRPPSRRMR